MSKMNKKNKKTVRAAIALAAFVMVGAATPALVYAEETGVAVEETVPTVESVEGMEVTYEEESQGTPTETPAEVPSEPETVEVEAPVETPAETPSEPETVEVEAPVETPVETPSEPEIVEVETLAETPVEAAVEEALLETPAEVVLGASIEENNTAQARNNNYSFAHETDEATEAVMTTLISIQTRAGHEAAQRMADQLVASYGEDIVNSMINYLDAAKRDCLNHMYTYSDKTYDDMEYVERLLMQAQVNNLNNNNSNNNNVNPQNPDPAPEEEPGTPDPAPEEEPGTPDPAPEEEPGTPNPAPEEEPDTTLTTPVNVNNRTTYKYEYDEEAENIISAILAIGKYSEDALNSYVSGIRESLDEDAIMGINKYITHYELDIEEGLDNSGRSFKDLEFVRNALLTAGKTTNNTPNPTTNDDEKGDRNPSEGEEIPSKDDEDSLDYYLDMLDKATEAYDKAKKVYDKAKDYFDPDEEAKELIPEVAGELTGVVKDLDKIISGDPNSLYAKSAKDIINKINGMKDSLDKVKNGQRTSIGNRDYDILDSISSTYEFAAVSNQDTDQIRAIEALLEKEGMKTERRYTPEVKIKIVTKNLEDGTVNILIFKEITKENKTYLTSYTMKPVASDNADISNTEK